MPKGWDNIATRALVGGAASRLSGGKFANGAFTASFNYLLNDLGDHEKKEQPALSDAAKFGAVGGAILGGVVAGGCDWVTVGACAIANPGIVVGGGVIGAAAGATFGEAVDSATKSLAKLIHGNSWLSPEPTSVYVLNSIVDGSILKFGVTNLVGNERARYTDNEYEKMGGLMTTIATFSNRAQALMTEKTFCFGYVAINGKLPPLSKTC